MRTADELFGLEVQAQRESKGWSMTEFAAMLSAAGLSNFHPTTVGRMERGERPVRLNEAVIIAQVLGSTLDDLVVEPLPGDEEVKEAMENIERLSKDAAVTFKRIELWRTMLATTVEELDARLREGAIHPEHKEDVEASLESARGMLNEDRFSHWVDKIEALSTDDERKLLNEPRFKF